MSWQDRDYNRDSPQTSQTRYQGGGGAGGGGFSRIGGGGGALSGAPITKWLLIINCIVFLLDGILGGSSRGSAIAPSNWGAFSIQQAIYDFQIWRFFSYQFIHAGLGHLFFNMIGLYFFGPLVERWWGEKRYLAFYLLNGSCGALLFTLLANIPGVIAPKNAPIELIETIYLVGASGSLFGNLVACSLLYPTLRVMLLIPPIPMTMRTLANIFLGIAVFSLVVGASNAGGEAAHLGGAVLGFILIKKARWLNFVDKFSGFSPAEIQLKRLQKKAQQKQVDLVRQQEQVNQILDKVRTQGLQSLTAKEQRILKTATDQQRDAG